MLSIILVRHGQTDHNKAHRIQGHLDIPLNEVGTAQASKLQPILIPLVKDSPVPVTIMASDLKRAFQTAEIALDGQFDIQPDPLLREINYGSWQGLNREEVRERYSEGALQWFTRADHDFNPHGGESMGDLHDRLQRFHETCILPLLDETNRRILLFTHGGTLNAYLNVVLNTRLRYTYLNCAVSEILLPVEGIPHLHLLNQLPEQEPRFYSIHH